MKLSAGSDGSAAAGGLHLGRRAAGERFSKLSIIGRFFRGIQQTDLRRGDLIEQPLRPLGMLAGLVCPQMHHPLIGGSLDYVGVALESL